MKKLGVISFFTFFCYLCFASVNDDSFAPTSENSILWNSYANLFIGRAVSGYEEKKTKSSAIEIPLPPAIPAKSKISKQEEMSYEAIKNYYQTGNVEYAKKLALIYLSKYPHDGDVRLVLGQIYMKEKNYAQAEYEFRLILAEYPKYADARIFLAEIALAQNSTYKALIRVHEGLALEMNNPYLLNEKAKILFTLHQYAQAAAIAKGVIKNNPNNSYAISQAQNILSQIKEISPRYTYGLNEIGFWTNNDYVSDLHSTWDLSSLYYSYDSYLGRIAAAWNYASRFGNGASQGELDFSPIINKYIYFDFMGAYSDFPEIFPNEVFKGEGYFFIPHFIDISAGDKYSIIGQTYFNAYTGSLSKEIKNYWISFRPYHFVPKSGPTSTLYTATLRRYFGTSDHYIGITGGTGRSPDLADLETVNFFTIKNTFIAANYEFPLFQHHIVADIGVDYQHWTYPNNLVRRLTGGTIGFKYRF